MQYSIAYYPCHARGGMTIPCPQGAYIPEDQSYDNQNVSSARYALTTATLLLFYSIDIKVMTINIDLSINLIAF